MGALRAGTLLAGFAGLTVPLLPLQEILLQIAPARARTFPNWYHRRVCKLLGISLHVSGEVASTKPVLLVANHTSWLDIPVLSATAPLSFVAKREVGGWPGVATLARLQRTVFVDRDRRADLGATAGEIRARLKQGDTLILFAEGTSSDGNQVLPFNSSLFAAVMPPPKTATRPNVDPLPASTVVQTVALAYTRRNGVPLGRADRAQIGWYGDMEMSSHAWNVLRSGPLDVEITIGPPVPVESFKTRKELARATEHEVRRNLTCILRARDPQDDFENTPPRSQLRRSAGFTSPANARGGMR